jgi:hypothetical protein
MQEAHLPHAVVSSDAKSWQQRSMGYIVYSAKGRGLLGRLGGEVLASFNLPSQLVDEIKGIVRASQGHLEMLFFYG